jgi:hypothetical protein
MEFQFRPCTSSESSEHNVTNPMQTLLAFLFIDSNKNSLRKLTTASDFTVLHTAKDCSNLIYTNPVSIAFYMYQ